MGVVRGRGWASGGATAGTLLSSFGCENSTSVPKRQSKTACLARGALIRVLQPRCSVLVSSARLDHETAEVWSLVDGGGLKGPSAQEVKNGFKTFTVPYRRPC